MTANGSSRPCLSQAGFSIIELMVAITLGLIILAGLTVVFINSSRTRDEVERANRQIENGRYAMQLLTDDLRNAGYLAEFDPTIVGTPTAKPDPCATALGNPGNPGSPTDSLNGALALHVQGYDNGASAPTCLTDVKAGTDILVIRRASTCAAGSANCDAVAAGVPYFQASLCANSTELNSTDLTSYYALDTNTAALTRHQRDCTTVASFYRYRTHIYYIANNNQAGDGIPTLMRAELGANAAGSAAAFNIVPLVEGIENLQLEYGIDLPAVSGGALQIDGTADAYTANPDSYPVATGKTVVDNWRYVVAAKVYLLARNTEATPGHLDDKTYTLGLKADGSANTFVPTNDQYKRHAYQATVRLNNPAGRNAP